MVEIPGTLPCYDDIWMRKSHVEKWDVKTLSYLLGSTLPSDFKLW